MNFNSVVRFSPPCLALVLAALAGIGPACAADPQEQARAQCREKFVPVVQGCVRQKVMQSGGSPAKYIEGCRAAIMGEARDCVIKLMAVARAGATAVEALATETDLSPPSGKGRVVIVLSGSDGPDSLKDYAGKIAALGYYTVLLDGKAILAVDKQGGKRLKDVIAKAQSAPNALPGKVAVIGKPMELVVYPNADHDFIAGPNYRADDADDAWKRTTDALHQAFGDAAH
jgi:hypothetical protein